MLDYAKHIDMINKLDNKLVIMVDDNINVIQFVNMPNRTFAMTCRLTYSVFIKKKRSVMIMEKEYIQLPPLPEDTPWDVLNVLWEFAKLSEEERIDALNYLETLEDFAVGEGELEALQEITDKYKDQDIKFFNRVSEILRNVLAMLTVNSYEMAALIYQKRCVEGLSKEQIAEEAGLSPDKLELFIKYYDIRKEQAEKESEEENE